MVAIILQFLMSALVIVVAGYYLAKFVDLIADITGWGKMFVGGLLLAGATSLPELSVDIHAVQMNMPDLAVGDLLGSSMFNLLILSILDFAYPSAFRRTAFSPNFLHHSLSATLSILLTGLVGISFLTKTHISLLGIDLMIWLVVVFYILGLRMIYMENQIDTRVDGERRSFVQMFSNKSLLKAFGGYIVCIIFILMAAPYLVDAADQLAKLSGLGHTFIGTTLVALSTSLPELVTTLVAFRMGSPDLAIGNIFGSNAFNMILFAPLDLMFSGRLLGSVNPIHMLSAFGVVVITSLALMGMLYRKKQRSRFSEPSSEMMIAIILLMLVLLYFSRTI